MSFVALTARSRQQIPESLELNERRAALLLRAVLSDEAEGRRDGAFSRWPRATGISADQLDWGIEARGSQFTAFVEDLVWYAGFVPLDGQTAWEVLIEDPFESEEEQVTNDVADAVLRGLVS